MTRRHEGMGLGLSIARDLVNLHNGRIWVESQLGKGSNFYVALPLAKPL
jgi:signal transduction histidine kinase